MNEERFSVSLTLDQLNAATPAQFAALLDGAKEQSDWKGFAARRRQSKKAGKLRGIGCGMFIEPSGGGGVKKDDVAVLFQADGAAVGDLEVAVGHDGNLRRQKDAW